MIDPDIVTAAERRVSAVIVGALEQSCGDIACAAALAISAAAHLAVAAHLDRATLLAGFDTIYESAVAAMVAEQGTRS